MGNPVCVVVGAGTKYASNEVYYGDTDSSNLPSDVKWGLGGALPIAFAEEGYDVCVMSRALDNLAPIAEHITGLGRRCEAIECDCSSHDSILAAFSSLRQSLGDAVDVLVYNAGYAQPSQDGNPMGGQLAHEIPIENFDMSYAVHVSGLLLCAQQVRTLLLLPCRWPASVSPRWVAIAGAAVDDRAGGGLDPRHRQHNVPAWRREVRRQRAEQVCPT